MTDGSATSPRVERLESGVLLCALAFVMLFGYAVARPSTESLFLAVYGTGPLPFAWLAVAVAAALVVTVYNHAAARAPLGRVMLGAIALTAVTLALLLGGQAARIPGATFLLYVWKDVHIVVLLEVLWSFANLVFETQTARWFNGVFCASGSLGGLTGNLLVGVVAARWGTDSAPIVLLPLFAVEALLVVALARAAGAPAPRERVPIALGDAARLLQKSPYLGWMALLIGTVQLVINLIDFVYQGAIAAAYPDIDARTAIMGQLYGVIDLASLALQLGSGLVIGTLGVRATLLAVPSVLGIAVAAFVVSPRFALVAVAKVASKAFDYSVFRAAKEMLYLPLGYEDKTRGKALVDMLTYRVAKGGASLVILGLGAASASVAVLTATLGAIGVWLAVTVAVTRRYLAVLRRTDRAD